MGIWTGIKKALNSTVGTGQFKPLDIIVDNIVYKYVLGSKQFIANDNLIISYTSSGNISIPPGGTFVLGQFTPAIGGSIRVNFTIESDTSNVLSLTVYDKTSGTTKFQKETWSGGQINDRPIYVDMDVENGHLYSIVAMYTDRYSDSISKQRHAFVKDVFISGSVSEAPLYNYKIGG